MIRSILIFNLNSELIIEKHYGSKLNSTEIIKIISENQEINFYELEQLVIVHKKFEDLIVAFVTFEENEMYVLSLINLMMNAMDKLLNGINQKSFIYNFKDVSYTIDNFVLNGKVICLDPLDISISPHYIKPFVKEDD